MWEAMDPDRLKAHGDHRETVIVDSYVLGRAGAQQLPRRVDERRLAA